MQNEKLQRRRRVTRKAGFTLVEMMIALLVFGTISAAAFSLMTQHAPIFNQQQNQAGLNISMRNAVAQIQADMVNGGAGYYNGLNVPNWPVSVVILNNVVASTGNCATGTTYGANCFDNFTIIAADPATTAVSPLASTSGSLPTPPGPYACIAAATDTSASNDIYVLPPANGAFQKYDQVLLVKSDGSVYTTVRLTGVTNVTVAGTAYVKLSHSSLTSAPSLGPPPTNGGVNVYADDPTNMSVLSGDSTAAQFCATDYVIRLLPIQYCVDTTTDPTNPTLRRTLLNGLATSPSATCQGGTALANQIIGFKVGATLTSGVTDTSTYNFNSGTTASGGYNYDFASIHSIMVSMIGRTTPNPGATYVFRNSFDGGPYQIHGVSIVVNPRNMNF
jgi:prepilin-type N-terminal cleavage/methylation domain-containing protein